MHVFSSAKMRICPNIISELPTYFIVSIETSFLSDRKVLKEDYGTKKERNKNIRV